MKDFQQRKKIRKFLYSRFGFFLALIFTILLVKGAWGVIKKEMETSADLNRVKESLTAARTRELELTGSVESLQTPQGVEKEIRNKFDVAKTGEEVIMVVDPKQTEDISGGEPPSFWQKIGNWFKNVF